MSKIVSIVTIITALIVIVLSILQLVQGIFFPGVQALFVALLMACLAYSHYQKHHKRKLVNLSNKHSW
jgi:peptidoglycan/LPS O-acetylase OafA/YrhL